MRRYIVTQDQLDEFKVGVAPRKWAQDAVLEKITECKMIEVPDWATHFAGKIDDSECWVEKTQEIPK